MAGISRIPLSAFLQYASLYQFSRLDSQELWESVRTLDSEFISFHEKRQSKEAEKAKTKTKRPGQKA